MADKNCTDINCRQRLLAGNGQRGSAGTCGWLDGMAVPAWVRTRS